MKNERKEVALSLLQKGNRDKKQLSVQLKTKFYHSPAIRKRFDVLVKDSLFVNLLIFSCRLVTTIDVMVKNLTNINEVFITFNGLLNDNGGFYFNSDRELFYCFSHRDEFEESPELLLIVILGICAAHRISLDLLEDIDDDLKGVSSVLSQEFHETYKAYHDLSKLFDFRASIRFY
jgi:hypothetical protein